MTKKTFVTKENGNTLEASEWNELTGYINEAVDAINAIPAGGSPSSSDTSGVVSVNAKGNTTISATKHINIEPAYDTTGSASGTYGDVQIKPGDDITLESHHRATSKRDEITIKTSNGQDGNAKAPVKLQVIAADMTLSTKGKKVETGSNDSSNVMNVNVTTGNGKGYLKVRAQAIDLRCEEHGGIALQPMGKDSQNHMNKIKFEHGGGDGLEFGTFNAEKTSIFTDEYRFNKNGVWKMATRTKVASDKAVQLRFVSVGTTLEGDSSYEYADNGGDYVSGNFPTFTANSLYTVGQVINSFELNENYFLQFISDNIGNTIDITTYAYNNSSDEYTADKYYQFAVVANNNADETALYKYVKAADDFYDNVDADDETATTNAIIKTAHALNDGKNRHAKYEEKVTTGGELKKTVEIETVVTITYSATESAATSQIVIPKAVADVTKTYTISEFKDAIKTVTVGGTAQKYGTAGDDGITLSAGDIVTIGSNNYTIVENFAPSMDITSNAELSLKGKEKLKLGGGIVEFGSDIVDLGEMETGLRAEYKLTKKNNTKQCDKVQIFAVNNHASNPLSVTTYTASHGETLNKVNPGASGVIAECSLLDIINFITWAKANNYGYWDPNNASSPAFNNVIGEGSQAENPGGEVATEEQTPGEEVPSGN